MGICRETGAALRMAENAVTCARSRERIDVSAVTSTTRKYRLVGDVVRSGTPVRDAEALIRVASSGRDIYTSVRGTDPGSLDTAVRAARHLLPWGRIYGPARPVTQYGVWNRPTQLADCSDLSGSLSEVLAELHRLADVVGSRQGTSLRIMDCLLTQERKAVAFGSSEQQLAADYALVHLELRVLVQVERGDSVIRLWTARHGHQLWELPMEEMLEETGWRGSALLLVEREPPSRNKNVLSLSPRVSASILGLIVNDLIGDTPVGPGPFQAAVVDDPLAVAGPHARRFDDEGVPSELTVLLNRKGAIGQMACRGSGDGKRPVPLTGHAKREGDGNAPKTLPSNVRLAGDPIDCLGDDVSGILAYEARGDGVQRLRSGNRFTIRLSIAEINDSHVLRGAGPMTLTATTSEILSAILGTASTQSYFPMRDYSVGGTWLALDRRRLSARWN